MDRRPLRLLLLVLVPVVLTTVMWFCLWSPVPEPDSLTTAVLEAAADRWWPPNTGYRYIPAEEWPPELLRLQPKAVRVGPEGVFIPLGSFYVHEWGLFILPRASNYQPQQGTDPSFRFLRDRVYRYEIKG